MASQPSAKARAWLLGGCLLAGCAPRGQGALPRWPDVDGPVSCARVVPLTAGRSVVADTEHGLDAMHGRCVAAGAPACVFELRVPRRSALRLRTEASDFDASLALLTGPHERPTELACVDDSPVGDLLHARIETVVEAGTYWVVVDSAAGETGHFELFSELDPLPDPGLVCRDVPMLSEGQFVRGSTRGGLSHFTATCAGGAPGPDHVYALDVATSSRVRLHLASEFDGALSLRARCDAPASELACNDEGGALHTSRLTASVPPGHYFVVVDAFSPGQSGEYTLLAERIDEPEARSLSEVCAASALMPRGPGSYELDTFSGHALGEGGCGGDGAPEQRITVRVDEPGLLRARLERPEFAAVLYLLRTCSDEASEITCFEAPPYDRRAERGDLPDALEHEVEPGLYTLVVDGAAPGEMGAAGLTLSLEPRPPAP